MLACQARDPGFKSRPRRQLPIAIPIATYLLQCPFAISLCNTIINIDANMIINMCVIMNARTIVIMGVR